MAAVSSSSSSAFSSVRPFSNIQNAAASCNNNNNNNNNNTFLLSLPPSLRITSTSTSTITTHTHHPSISSGGGGTSLSLSKHRACQALSDAASIVQPNLKEVVVNDDVLLPTPIVIIDQESDPDATVVDLSFGDRLGALLDTMRDLKQLGLNVVKSTLSVEGPIGRKRFSITEGESGRKIEDPEMLEAIRLTIINNMLEYHPESSALLAMGSVFGVTLPSQLDVDITTQVHITPEGPHRSLLYIQTADRPGLLREIVKFLKDTNLSFESGEFDTEGLVAKLKFHVKYRGEGLSKSMKQVIINSFQYFLRRPDTNEDSY